MSLSKRLLEPETGEHEEHIPTVSGRSQDDLIHEFVRLDSDVREKTIQKRDVAMALAGIAFEHRGEQNTVHVTSTDGLKVKVEFGIDFEYDNAQMFTVADLLGREVFDDLFEARIEFKPKRRNLKLFMNTVPAEEKARTAQQIIRDATMVKERTPYVSTEKSR